MMPRKIYKPEEIIAKLRQVGVLTSQGKYAVDAIRSLPRMHSVRHANADKG
jgi:hypothetical protein